MTILEGVALAVCAVCIASTMALLIACVVIKEMYKL